MDLKNLKNSIMGSIVGEKNYRSASGSGWAVTDKVFGYIDKAVNIYNKGRAGTVEGVSLSPELEPEIGLFGMPKPWGGVLLFSGLLITGVVIYKIAK